MSKITLFLRAWGPSLLMMVTIFCFSSITSNGMPNFGSLDFLFKKGGHATGYALLALANLRALSKGRRASAFSRADGVGWDRKRWWLAWLIAALYSATDEFHQSFVPGRSPALMDVGIDAFGAAAGLLLWGWVKDER